MFRRRKKEDPARKRGAVEKVIMGAIIGTAVGSVIGLTVAPKKGEDTRDDVKEIGKLTKETATGLFNIAKRLMTKDVAPKSAPKSSPKAPRAQQGLRKIPNEMEVKQEEPKWVIPDQD